MRLLKVVAVSGALLAGVVSAADAASPAVGSQYDSTHVYVAPDQVDRFVASVVATFGGQSTKPVTTTVTPTPSSTSSQLVFTPYGPLSVFGFSTPIPYPFGSERTGYLVSDMDAAIKAARAAGAEVVVAPFADPIGHDAVIRWPGGVAMQLYTHNTAPSYAALATVPENRVYVSADAADAFVRGFLAFSGGRVVSDEAKASGAEIGRPDEAYRRIRLESGFGKMAVLVTDGHLPWPFGRELTGYEVPKLDDTLAKARAAGAEVLVAPFRSDGREAALIRFPGGYIAEVHTVLTTP